MERQGESLMSIYYRGAIALNNLGVTLLERGDLTEAMETFRDSLSVIKLILEGNSGGADRDGGLGENACRDDHGDMKSKLHTATQRVFRPPASLQQEQQQGAATAACRSFSSDKEEVVVVVEDGDVTTMNDAVRYGPTWSLVYAIRINHTDESICDVEVASNKTSTTTTTASDEACTGTTTSRTKEVNVTAAIIMFNLAMTRVCSARRHARDRGTSSCGDAIQTNNSCNGSNKKCPQRQSRVSSFGLQKRRLRGALKLLHISQSFLANSGRSENDNDENKDRSQDDNADLIDTTSPDDMYRHSRLVLLSALSMSSTFQGLRDLGSTTQAYAALDRFNRLVYTLRSMESYFTLITAKNEDIAAAA